MISRVVGKLVIAVLNCLRQVANLGAKIGKLYSIQIKSRLKTISPNLLRILIVLAVIISLLPPLNVKAASGDVFLLWDTANGTIPSGWTCASCVGGAFEKKFIMPSKDLLPATGGTDTVTHTFTPANPTSSDTGTLTSINSGGSAGLSPHSDNFSSFTSGSTDIKPSYNSLKVIYKSSPTFIPQNTVGMFDVTSIQNLPEGWQYYSSQESQYLYTDTSTGIGGNANHSHTRSATTSVGGSTSGGVAGQVPAAASGHRHTIASGTTGITANTPSFVTLVFASAKYDTPLYKTRGLVAMFDSTTLPPGWTQISNSGTNFVNRIIKGDVVGGVAGGSDNHTHNGGTTGSLTTGPPNTTFDTTAGNDVTANTTHTHTITFSISSDNSVPVWKAVILARYTGFSKLEQQAYIWENDDGTTVDGNTQLAGNNTAITALRGQRLNLRVHLKNTGTGASLDNLGLFYDRGDNNWRKVSKTSPVFTANGSGCTNLLWTCTNVSADFSDYGAKSQLAYDKNGNPWIVSTQASINSNDLYVANYVGVGGNCASSKWNCDTVDNIGSSNTQASIQFDRSGTAYISKYDNNATSLEIMKYVGSGGSGCSSTAWTCTVVDNTGSVGNGSKLSFDLNNNPQISYYDSTNSALRFATYVGSGGNCTNTAWNCTIVDNDIGGTTNTGTSSSITYNEMGYAQISYNDTTNTALKYATYVGSGGNCTSTAWNCTIVDNDIGGTTDTGENSSIATDSNGIPHISYNDKTNTAYKYAKYVGSGGNCTNTAWNCTIFDTDVGYGSQKTIVSSIILDVSNTAYISYYDSLNNSLKLATYVGTGGNCTDPAWNCTQVDDSASDVGDSASIAISSSGKIGISYHVSTSTKLAYAELNRYGEITSSSSLVAQNGNIVTKSHADMTTYDDVTSRDNANCIGGGTFNNGAVSLTSNSSVSLPAGSVTAQCTELTFSLDTSNAVPGTTYRFVVATKDGWDPSRGAWRGPSTITQYPTVTINGNSETILSKDNMPIFANCTDTAWGCSAIDTTNSVGVHTSMAIDPSGNPWVSYLDATNNDLRVAQYVGSGGTGCATTAWTCTAVDTSNSVGNYSSIVFDTSGNPWVSYYDATNSDLRVAQYVGSGGTGCATTAWTCTSVDTANDVGSYDSITMDPSGNPWVSYYDATNSDLRVAKYVGSGGTGCATTAWTCTSVDTANDVGQHTAITTDSNGRPWVSYYDSTSITGGDLRVAQYVGSGGTGCASSAWTCTAVETANTVGQYTSIAMDPSGKPWVSHFSLTGGDLRVAQYVGSGGTGCASSAWTCTAVETTNDVGHDTSITIDSAGNPWVTHTDRTTNDLRLAKYVGSGGTGCASSAWTCTAVDTPNTVGQYSSIAMDSSGTPWISYYDDTNFDLRVAKMHLPPTSARPFAQITNKGRSAAHGLARYLLDDGRYPATSPQNTCGAGAGAMGYCGAFESQGSYDAITAGTNARAIFVGATKFSSNSVVPQINWVGQSNVAASSGNIIMQVYRFGTTKAWETLATDSTCAANTNCVLSRMPTGTPSEYYETIGSDKWVYYRVYQLEGASSITLKTDEFRVYQQTRQLRGGRVFENGDDQKLRTLQ